MNFSRAFAALVVLVFAAIGCMAADHAEPAPMAAAPQALQAGEPAPSGVAPADRAMRITTETSIVVGDIDAASRRVRALVAEHGGYVGEATTGGSDNARTAFFVVHIPVARLAAFRGGVGELGEIFHDSEKSEDVTEQRADIKARLANARASETRLLELLAKHTGSLADVVAVEKELSAVRETIERMEAQQRVLEGQIASATVKIDLSTRDASPRIGPGRRIARAAGDGVSNAGKFLVGLAVVVASGGPTALLVAAMGYAFFWVVRFLHRRIQVKKR